MTDFIRFQASAACPWATEEAALRLIRQAPQAALLKDEEETRIWRLEAPDGGETFLKEYRIPTRRRWLASLVRSRASREWRALEAMQGASLPVAAPCFSIEGRRGPWLETSLLATASLGQVQPLPTYLAAADAAAGLATCRRVGHLVRRMHDLGFGHFRLQAKNLMVQTEVATAAPGAAVALLDAPYACRWVRRQLPPRIRRLDLEDLAGVHSALTQAQKEAVLAAYREADDPIPAFQPGKRSRSAQKLRRIAYYLLAIWSGHRP